jgi:hypothetical protein
MCDKHCNKPVKNEKPLCFDPGHNVPMMMVFPPGENKWVCNACGNVIVFMVNGFY